MTTTGRWGLSSDGNPHYWAARALCSALLRSFYRSIEVTDQSRRLTPARPTILAVTHPNSVLDPLLVAVIEPKPVTFSVRAGPFSDPLFGRLLRGIGAIPIARPEDRGPDPNQCPHPPLPRRVRWSRRRLKAALAELALGHGKRARRTARDDNHEAFAAAREVLSDGGTLVIFPEGETHANATVNRLRTGAARLALDAEHQSGWTLGLALTPVALNYLERETFQSDVHIAYGPPVDFSDLASLYVDAPPLAVRELTDRLTEALRKLALDLDPDDDRLIAEIAEIAESPPTHAPRPSDRAAHLKRTAHFWRWLLAQEPAAAADLRARVDAVFSERTRHPILAALTARHPALAPTPFTRATLYAMTPLALWGLATSGPTYLVAHALASRLSPRRDRRATTLIALGAPLLAAAWTFQSALTAMTLGPPIALAHALTAPPCALLAARFTTALRNDLATALSHVVNITHHPLAQQRRLLTTSLASGQALYRSANAALR